MGKNNCSLDDVFADNFFFEEDVSTRKSSYRAFFDKTMHSDEITEFIANNQFSLRISETPLEESVSKVVLGRHLASEITEQYGQFTLQHRQRLELFANWFAKEENPSKNNFHSFLVDMGVRDFLNFFDGYDHALKLLTTLPSFSSVLKFVKCTKEIFKPLTLSGIQTSNPAVIDEVIELFHKTIKQEGLTKKETHHSNNFGNDILVSPDKKNTFLRI
ncbi:hypothetical protein K9M74_00385 [Candidatus Woesearchaeota archaeon]|nr:hypothetical protein [Candidatus Woesearchaeota archaeon]